MWRRRGWLWRRLLNAASSSKKSLKVDGTLRIVCPFLSFDAAPCFVVAGAMAFLNVFKLHYNTRFIYLMIYCTNA